MRDLSFVREELRLELLACGLSSTAEIENSFSIFRALSAKLKEGCAAYNALCWDWTPESTERNDRIELLCPKVFADQLDTFSTFEPPRIDFEALVREVIHLSLYCDKLWLPDPVEIMSRWVEDFAYPDIAQGVDFGGNRGWQKALAAIEAFQELQPLVDAGYIAFYPHTNLYFRTVSEALFGEVRPFSKDELVNAWPDLYVAEGISYANALNISYAAVTRDEKEAMSRAINECHSAIGLVDARFIAATPRLELPYFDRLSPSTIVRARRNEEEFECFRAVLRQVGVSLAGGVEDPAFDTEVHRIESEILTPAIEKLRRGVSTVELFKDNLAKSGIEFSATTATCLALTGEPISSLLTGSVTAASSSIAKAIADRTKASPASKVAYLLSSQNARRQGFLLSKKKRVR